MPERINKLRPGDALVILSQMDLHLTVEQGPVARARMDLHLELPADLQLEDTLLIDSTLAQVWVDLQQCFSVTETRGGLTDEQFRMIEDLQIPPQGEEGSCPSPPRYEDSTIRAAFNRAKRKQWPYIMGGGSNE